MFMQRLFDTLRDATRKLAADPTVTTVTVDRPAANASRWINESGQARRRRRSARSGPSRINGWTVRTW